MFTWHLESVQTSDTTIQLWTVQVLFVFDQDIANILSKFVRTRDKIVFENASRTNILNSANGLPKFPINYWLPKYPYRKKQSVIYEYKLFLDKPSSWTLIKKYLKAKDWKELKQLMTHIMKMNLKKKFNPFKSNFDGGCWNRSLFVISKVFKRKI